jgi:glycosyltransferase involved in cell wall biosynthesis
MKISVYITSYNNVNSLKLALESVLQQTHPADEILLIDDGSTDGSREWIATQAELLPDLIKPVFHRKNRGIAAVRNTALATFSGHVITGLDGDDTFFPSKLADEAAALQRHPEAGFAYSNYLIVEPAGEERRWSHHQDMLEGNIFIPTFARKFPGRILFRSQMMRRTVLSPDLRYDTHLPTWEDFDFRIRLSHKHKAVYCQNVNSTYVRHENGLSQTEIWNHLELLSYIYQKNRHLLDNLPAAKSQTVHDGFMDYYESIGQKELIRYIQDTRPMTLADYRQVLQTIQLLRRYRSSRLYLNVFARLLLPERMAGWLKHYIYNGLLNRQ